jgi:eukaryotic-like serine/threonine-protein kinase
MSPADADSPVQPGQLLAGGKYRVEHVLGIGGMGVVVAATHLQLGQPVAIKFMLPAALKDKESVERFVREARSAAQLKSEHVARVLDVGTLETGAPYIVMEYLEGITLDRFLDEGNTLSIGEAVEFTIQVCEAVAEAHVRGIVHRDLKPTNLFMTKGADKRPLIKVIDFGLSKTLGANSRKITRDFSIMGTPTYMSPEQLRSTSDVDTRTDIWALGVVLYELLTGHVPFHADAVAEVCALVLASPPRPIHEVHRDVPPELAAVIMRCLEKEPNHRFATVAELAEALNPFVPAGTGNAGDRIRRVQTDSVMAPRYGSQPLPDGPGRKTQASWGTDAMMMAGSKPNHLLWIAVTIVIAALGIGALVFGLRMRAATEAQSTNAAVTPPELPVEAPPPSTADPGPAPGTSAAPDHAGPVATTPARPGAPRSGTGGARPAATANASAKARSGAPSNRDKLLETR